jgi:fructokinase
MLIGIDWGGTKIEGVALEATGQELLRLREETPKGDYEACIRAIAALVTRIEAETGRRGLVGIGIPGSLSPTTGLAKGASSTWLIGRPVEADLLAALARPLRVVNDADCLAFSEAIDGAGAGYRVVFAVILGTGAGAGIAIDGRPHHGPNNSAGEWGHNPLPFPTIEEMPGTPCYCGRRGCLETWISGTGFANDYNRHAVENDYSRATAKPATSAQVIERMRQGDRFARMVYERYVDRLARGLALVVNALDPDVFVLGGGMSNVDELYEDLPPALARRTFSPVFITPILRAKHGDSSGVRGAAWLWKDQQS